MRMNGRRIALFTSATVVVAASAAVLLGLGSGFERVSERPNGSRGPAAGYAAVSVAKETPKLSWVKPGTRKSVGAFQVRGRTVLLETAESTDGEECLLDTELGTGGTGATCSKDGLFAARKVVFSLNFDGGPDVFRSLDVLGVAAPGVASVALSRTDGSVVRVDLDRTRAFVIESSAADLEANVLPARLELFGPSGKRIESVAIPALR